MKSTVSSIEIVSSRVRFLLLASFTALMLAAAIGISGCGGGSGGGGGGGGEDSLVQAAFDTESADARYMEFDLDGEAAKDVTEEEAGGVYDGEIFVRNINGDDLITDWGVVEDTCCTIYVTAQVPPLETFDVQLSMSFTPTISPSESALAGKAASAAFPDIDAIVSGIKSGPDKFDADGDGLADHPFVNRLFNCDPQIKGRCVSAGMGEAIILFGSDVAGITQPVSLRDIPRGLWKARSKLAGSGLKLGPSMRHGDYDLVTFSLTGMVNVGNFSGGDKAAMVASAGGYPEVKPFSILSIGNGLLPDLDAWVPGEKEPSKSVMIARNMGDHDGDGYADLLLMVLEEKTGVQELYIVPGGLDGALGQDDAIPVTLPVELGKGTMVLNAAGVGDVNGDGLSDFAVAMGTGLENGETPAFHIYVYEGSAVEKEMGLYSWKIDSPENGSDVGPTRFFGVSLAGGDIDLKKDSAGKRRAEILVGAPSAVPSVAGLAYLYAKDDAEESGSLLATFSGAAPASAEKIFIHANPIPTENLEMGFGMSVELASVVSARGAQVIVASPLENRVLIFSGAVGAGDEPEEIGPDKALAILTIADSSSYVSSASKAHIVEELEKPTQNFYRLMGFAVKNMGDMSGNGLDDIAIYGRNAMKQEVRPLGNIALNVVEGGDDVYDASAFSYAFLLFGDSAISAGVLDVKKDLDHLEIRNTGPGMFEDWMLNALLWDRPEEN